MDRDSFNVINQYQVVIKGHAYLIMDSDLSDSIRNTKRTVLLGDAAGNPERTRSCLVILSAWLANHSSGFGIKFREEFRINKCVFLTQREAKMARYWPGRVLHVLGAQHS